MKRLLALTPLFMILTGTSWSNDSNWQDLGMVAKQEAVSTSSARPAAGAETGSSGMEALQRYRRMTLDEEGLRDSLNQGGVSSSGAQARPGSLTISLPLPDGSFASLRVTPTEVLAPEVAALHPEIQTWKVIGTDGKVVSGVIDLNSNGFHAMLDLPNGDTVFIDPQEIEGLREYASFSKRSNPVAFKRDWTCATHNAPSFRPELTEQASVVDSLVAAKPVEEKPGETLHEYDIAVAATTQYTTLKGGEDKTFASIVTTIARVNQIYERDLSIRLRLVSGTNTVFTTDEGDGYSSSTDNIMDQNGPILDGIIGNDKYDIGHVFASGTTGSSKGQLESVCDNKNKAQGVTTTDDRSGDAFDIDYVAHEIGHQFGGNHTFNSCDGKQTSKAEMALEPGSGSTIMAYAGICGSTENLQKNTDAMFHAGSIKEMTAFAHDGAGRYSQIGPSCATKVALNNANPVANAGSDYNIPPETPFILTGAGTDADGDTLTYSWEQMDAGARSVADIDTGDNALIRAHLPTSSPTRTIPQISDLISGIHTVGENTTSWKRTLNFRLTVRDGKGGAGYDDMQVITPWARSSSSGRGAFAITSPLSPSRLQGGSQQTIEWDVSDTTSAPINCSKVDVDISVDKGITFSNLKRATDNDGSTDVTLPNNLLFNGNFLRVKCSDNIFFAYASLPGDGEADLTPDAFQFVDQTGVSRFVYVYSNTITVSGINGDAPISVVNGKYSINGAAYTSAAGTVKDGDKVQVRLTSSEDYATPTSTTLTIGGVSGVFTGVTKVDPDEDTTPSAFNFAAQTNVTRSTEVTSASITVSGITAATPITVTGGEYSINGGAFTRSAGVVTNGATVRVRHTSSASDATQVDTTLTIGGIEGIFSSTTAAAGQDTTPDAFSFAAQTGVERSTTMTSESITVSGINAATPISVSGGQYSINGGAFTSTAGTVTNGQTVRVQHTSSDAYQTQVNTTLTIGGVNGIFSSTTKAEDVQQDTTPNAFPFTPYINVSLSDVITSHEITVSGINAPAPINVSGGQYSINDGAFTSAAGTVTNGATVRVQHTASDKYKTQVDTTLTIGGVSSTFSSTTIADPNVAEMAFVEQTDVQPGSVMTSNLITVSGLSAPVTLKVSGGTYSKNGGAYKTSQTTVQNGDTLQVRHTSSSRSTSTVATTLSLGKQTLVFKSTTLLIDNKPDAFGFDALTDVLPSSSQESTPVTLRGMNVAVAISVSGGEYSLNGAAYTKRSGTANAGDTVQVRHTSSSSSAKTVKTTLTVGGVKGEFSSKTLVIDDKPDAFNFETKDPVDTSSLISSGAVTISGINVPVAISVSNGEYSINGGPFTKQKGTIKAGDTLQLRHKSSSRSNRIVTTTVTVGRAKKVKFESITE